MMARVLQIALDINTAVVHHRPRGRNAKYQVWLLMQSTSYNHGQNSPGRVMRTANFLEKTRVIIPPPPTTYLSQ